MCESTGVIDSLSLARSLSLTFTLWRPLLSFHMAPAPSHSLSLSLSLIGSLSLSLSLSLSVWNAIHSFEAYVHSRVRDQTRPASHPNQTQPNFSLWLMTPGATQL